MSQHPTEVVLVTGSRRPAMSIHYAAPPDPIRYSVIFAELDPEADEEDTSIPCEPWCLCCFAAELDEQIGRGLDLARELNGQVDYDVEAGEWFLAEAPAG